MMDKLRSIEAFIAAVETGNFSAAARRLDITAVMIGKHVRQLEEALNARLLERNTRRQHLTEAGKTYYEACKIALAQLHRAETSVESLKRFPSGSLRISAPTTLGSCAIAELTTRYQLAFPDVRIELTLSDRFVDLVAEGFDFAIRIGELDRQINLVAQRIGDYQMVICATPHYLTQHGTPTTPDQLMHHRCIGNMVWNKRNAWRLTQQHFWPDNATFSSNDGQALRRAALAGAGIILQPQVLLAEDIASGRLITLLDDWRPEKRPIHLLYRQDLRPSPKRSSFIHWLKAHAPTSLNG